MIFARQKISVNPITMDGKEVLPMNMNYNMHSQISWKEYKSSFYGSVFHKFCDKLTREIRTVPERYPGKTGVLVLNTKKGYWMYKIYEREAYSSSGAGIQVLSDRRLKKELDAVLFADKFVYLVDDTLNQGLSLQESYNVLARMMDRKYICPLVFAINDSVDREEKKRGAATELEKSFWSGLKYYIKMSSSDMGEFCVSETLLIHNEGIPYLTELPYLKLADAKKMRYEVLFEDQQFKKLLDNQEDWIFRSYEYGISRYSMKCFMIQYVNEKFLKYTEDFVTNMIVEGTYVCSENKYKMVFVPCIKLKDLEKEELIKLYSIFIGKREELYKDPSLKKDEFSEGKLVEMYTELEFAMSIYLGNAFRKFIKKCVNVELVYDYDILPDFFPDFFKEQVKNLVKKNEEGWIPFGDLTFNVRCYNQPVYSLEENLLKFSEEDALDMVSEKIIQQKHLFLRRRRVNKYEDILKAIITKDDIDNIVCRKFDYHDKNEQNYARALCTCIPLQLSLGSEINYVFAGRQIKAGLRYGENSDLIMPFFNVYFYWAILIGKERIGVNSLLRIYDQYTDNLRHIFIKKGLFVKDDLTDRRFERNKEYYKEVLMDKLPLEDKLFSIYDYYKGKFSTYENDVMEYIDKSSKNITV